MSNSFAHLPLENPDMTSNPSSETAQPKKYDVYDNLFNLLEAALVESFVKTVIDDIDEVGYSSWQSLLIAWIAIMRGYLEVNNDMLDNCAEERAVEWYSTHFGRIREVKYGSWDLRVSKHLGSGKEMPVDMKGNAVDI